MSTIDPIIKPEAGRLLKAEQVAARLNVPCHTFRMWLSQGKFPELQRVKLGRLLRFREAEVERVVRGEIAFTAPAGEGGEQ